MDTLLHPTALSRNSSLGFALKRTDLSILATGTGTSTIQEGRNFKWLADFEDNFFFVVSEQQQGHSAVKCQTVTMCSEENLLAILNTLLLFFYFHVELKQNKIGTIDLT